MANKPVLHRRDHEHGGADPVRIVWESTGGEGAGSVILPTIKAIYQTTSPAGHLFIGQEAMGDDASWFYSYVLGDLHLLYIDDDGYIGRDPYDSDLSQGSMYLVTASARFSGMSDDDAVSDASMQVNRSDTLLAAEVEAFDKRRPISGEAWLQRAYVMAGAPPSMLEVRHSAASATNLQAVLCVTLLNPGPVPFP